jgi:hypothetical protein
VVIRVDDRAWTARRLRSRRRCAGALASWQFSRRVLTWAVCDVPGARDAIEELEVPVGFHPTGQSSLRDDIARRDLDHPNGRVSHPHSDGLFPHAIKEFVVRLYRLK